MASIGFTFKAMKSLCCNSHTAFFFALPRSPFTIAPIAPIAHELTVKSLLQDSSMHTIKYCQLWFITQDKSQKAIALLVSVPVYVGWISILSSFLFRRHPFFMSDVAVVQFIVLTNHSLVSSCTRDSIYSILWAKILSSLQLSVCVIFVK